MSEDVDNWGTGRATELLRSQRHFGDRSRLATTQWTAPVTGLCKITKRQGGRFLPDYFHSLGQGAT